MQSIVAEVMEERILWVLRPGSCWQDLPRDFGSKTCCHRRLKEWQEGVWERIWKVSLAALEEQERLDWRQL